MVNNKKALEAAKTVVEYCKEQPECQNCIFREFGCDSWKCHIDAFYLADVLSNIESKKKHGGYI